jgi:hypothetical protein
MADSPPFPLLSLYKVDQESNASVPFFLSPSPFLSPHPSGHPLPLLSPLPAEAKLCRPAMGTQAEDQNYTASPAKVHHVQSLPICSRIHLQFFIGKKRVGKISERERELHKPTMTWTNSS